MLVEIVEVFDDAWLSVGSFVSVVRHLCVKKIQYHRLAFPKKAPQNKLQRKHFTKKCVIHSYRDALPQKSTSPKTKETSYCHNTYFSYNYVHFPLSYR